MLLVLQEKSFDWQCLKNFEMILRFLTTLYVLTRKKSATKYIILWKVIITSFKISNCFYLVIFHQKKKKKNLKVLSMVIKMYIFLMLHPI